MSVYHSSSAAGVSALTKTLQTTEANSSDTQQYIAACRAAVQQNRTDQVERALHKSVSDDHWQFLNFFHVQAADFHKECLVAAIVALSRDTLKKGKGYWQRTETVGLAATLFSFLLQKVTTDASGKIKRQTFKFEFDALCFQLLSTAGIDRDDLDSSNIPCTQLCAVLASIITTGTLNMLSASFKKWEALETGLTSAITVIASTSSSIVKATTLPGAGIGSTVAASAGSVINAVITAGLKDISGEETAKPLIEQTLRTWLQNLLSALGVNDYSLQGIQESLSQVNGVAGASGGAATHSVSATHEAGASSTSSPASSDGPSSSTKAAVTAAKTSAGPAAAEAKHAAFKNEIVCSFLI